MEAGYHLFHIVCRICVWYCASGALIVNPYINEFRPAAQDSTPQTILLPLKGLLKLFQEVYANAAACDESHSFPVPLPFLHVELKEL